MTKTVLILGASYAGLGVAHRLLKYTLPKEPDLEVILVSKNSHFYWNLASVRAVVPGQLQDNDILKPIQPGLAKYPPGSVDFIIGSATGVDHATKTAQIASSSGTRSVHYDYLLIATGGRSGDTSMPWKAEGSYEETLASLHRVAGQVGGADRIVVAGAGATGIELAGELAFEFPSKTITLLCADEALAGGDSIAGWAENELRYLGVHVRKGTRSVGTRSVDGATEVTLQTGETFMVDLFLPTTGLLPNSEFLPKEWLTERGFVDVDGTMAVKGVDDVWAFGDVVSKPRASYLNADRQAAGVARNIELALAGKSGWNVRGMLVDVLICSIGRHRAAGRVGYVPILSLVGWGLKGRDLGRVHMAKYVEGLF